MKEKFNPLRTSDKPVSLLSASADELLSRRSGISLPLKLPYHPRAHDPSAQLPETPGISAVSPRSAGLLGRLPGDFRTGQETGDLDRSPRALSYRKNSDDTSSTNYDYGGAEEMDIDDASCHKRLHMDDSYAAGGQKRRAKASSPPRAEGGADDALRRRDVGTRGSPTPRLSNSTHKPPILSRSNSHVSTASMAPSTTTTTNSYEHRSPGAYSSGGVSPTSGNSPYATPISLNTSPRGSISTRTPTHSRTVSNATPRRLPEMQKPAGTKMQDFVMCECCPKKPKKFETREELR